MGPESSLSRGRGTEVHLSLIQIDGEGASEARPSQPASHQPWKRPFTVLLVLLFTCAVVGIGTYAWGIRGLAYTLACPDQAVRSDAIVIENLDNSYLPFERAGELQREGYGSRVFVLVRAARDGAPEPVAAGFAGVMAGVARLDSMQLVPFTEVEPVAMNAAYQVRQVIEQSGSSSVLVVTTGFRSRRTHLVYQEAFGPLGIAVHCVPVWGTYRPENWVHSWHGIQEVVLQVIKLHYYRLWVL